MLAEILEMSQLHHEFFASRLEKSRTTLGGLRTLSHTTEPVPEASATSATVSLPDAGAPTAHLSQGGLSPPRAKVANSQAHTRVLPAVGGDRARGIAPAAGKEAFEPGALLEQVLKEEAGPVVPTPVSKSGRRTPFVIRYTPPTRQRPSPGGRRRRERSLAPNTPLVVVFCCRMPSGSTREGPARCRSANADQNFS